MPNCSLAIATYAPRNDDLVEILPQFFRDLRIIDSLEVQMKTQSNIPAETYLWALVGTLPPAIKRLSIVRGRFTIPEVPFPETLDNLSKISVPNLSRLDFLDCKRADVEGALEAEGVLEDCERSRLQPGGTKTFSNASRRNERA